MNKLTPENLGFFIDEFEQHPETVLLGSGKAMARTTGNGLLRGVISQRNRLFEVTFIPVIGRPAKGRFNLDPARAVTFSRHGGEDQTSLKLEGIGVGDESVDPELIKAVNNGGLIGETVCRSAEGIAASFLRTEPMPINQQVAQVLLPVVA